VAAVAFLLLALAIQSRPQVPVRPSQEAPSSKTASKADATLRTEPEEPEISDREQRELRVRAEQIIGNVLTEPDESFFVYEWRRPYSWDKDSSTLPKSVPEHMQTMPASLGHIQVPEALGPGCQDSCALPFGPTLDLRKEAFQFARSGVSKRNRETRGGLSE
jgi:hypothetical protein